MRYIVIYFVMASISLNAQNVTLRYENIDFVDVKERIALFSEEGYLSGLGTNHFQLEDTSYNHILNGDLNPHFFLFDKSKYGTLVDLNPRLHFRILDQDSGPVRTPTANPGARLYFFWNRLVKPKRWTVFHLGYYHHSNGQDGPALASAADSVLSPEFSKINEGFIFNRYNGNFSTNYITAGINFYWNNCLEEEEYFEPWLLNRLNRWTDSWLPNLFPDVEITTYEYLLQCNADVHTGTWGNSGSPLFGFEPALRGYFSFLRPSIQFKAIRMIRSEGDSSGRYFEYDRWKINLSYGTGDMSALPDYNFLTRFNFDVTYHIRVLNSSFASLFVQAGWHGSDAYNIYLEDSFGFVQFGLSVGNFAFAD